VVRVLETNEKEEKEGGEEGRDGRRTERGRGKAKKRRGGGEEEWKEGSEHKLIRLDNLPISAGRVPFARK